jgi:hypothetical protein
MFASRTALGTRPAAEVTSNLRDGGVGVASHFAHRPAWQLGSDCFRLAPKIIGLLAKQHLLEQLALLFVAELHDVLQQFVDVAGSSSHTGCPSAPA